MSNLFKSKFLTGVAIVSVMFVAVLAFTANTSTASADCSITSTLRVGSTGAEVVCLQTALGGLTPDGSFGPKTKAAVMAWQSKEGLSPDGVFGPKSNAVWMSNANNSANFPVGCASAVGFSPSTGLPCNGAVNPNFPAGCTSTAGFSATTGMACSVTSNLPAGCSSTAGFSPTTGMACNGAAVPPGPGANGSVAGNISSDGNLGGFAGTVVGQGDVNHQVAAFQLTGAGGGSNLSLSNLTIQFNEDPANGQTGSSRFNDYFNAVSIWENGKMVGSAPASSFSSNTSGSLPHYVYSASIPLTGATVLAGQINNFYVAVSANSSLDSGNFSHNIWMVQVGNIRFTDGTGMTLVYNLTSVIGTGTAFASSPSFSFGSAASANNIVVNIARSGSDANSHTVTVTQNSGSIPKVPLLLMSVSSQGGQTVAINQMPVIFTPTGHSVFAMTGEVYLMQGTTVLDSEAIPNTSPCNTVAACTVNFKINPSNPLLISGPTTLTVAADINSITGGAYTAGDTLTVSTPSATTAYDITAGTPNGAELITSGNATQVIPGTANGQAVAFFATGLNVNVASDNCTPATVQGGPSTLTCQIAFSVSANGAPMYIPIASSSVPNQANTVNFGSFVSSSPTALISGAPSISATYVQNGSIAANGTDEWIIPAGATANFTGTVVIDDINNTHPALYRSYLTDVRYGATAAGTHAWANDYTFNLGATNQATPGYTFVN